MLKRILRSTFSRFNLGYVFGSLMIVSIQEFDLEFSIAAGVAICLGMTGGYLSSLLPE